MTWVAGEGGKVDPIRHYLNIFFKKIIILKFFQKLSHFFLSIIKVAFGLIKLIDLSRTNSHTI
jgi:hypothetical protein